MKNPAPNWYQDPFDARWLRYWDGRRWTEHVSRNPAFVEPPDVGTLPQPVPIPDKQQVPAQPSNERSDVPLFGVRNFAQQKSEEVGQLRKELADLRAEMDRLGALDVVELARQREELRKKVDTGRLVLADLERKVVKTQEEEILQEVGIYTYRHPLSDSTTYKEELRRLQDRIKVMARQDGGAVRSANSWNVNGSAAEGRKLVRDFSKLMLRAYNAEADNLVRSMKPYKLDSTIDRLTKVATTIARLGNTMSIRIAPEYQELRIKELELTADYLEILAREKEKERETRERLREERKVQQEIERERERLEKERQHYANVLARLESNGDLAAVEQARAKLEDIGKAIEDVDYRAANVRAGYVYVISNIGAFGERMIKIGMTRRLEPMDRIRELGDASVPFRFDVHALFFAEDAVGIEAEMHRRMDDRRVNRVNPRREFFYATPLEAREHLKELAGDLLEFNEFPEAVEFHQSREATAAADLAGERVTAPA
ncbi:DUF4041 domain-containing protein [Nocardia sp. NPDC004068]|uniref:DUF4041 domain-containing protein n=1 Tax=Nocardia sp. NPDC004068 TaxID=3364303 RepID=UPI0036B988A3